VKIIIVGPAYPYRGGIADTNESFCTALNELGNDASIVTFRLQYPSLFFPGKSQYSNDPAPENLEIKRWINSINPINWLIAARKINQLKADLIIFRYWTPFLAPCLGSIARFLSKKTKLLALCDNIVPHEHKWFDRLFTSYFVKPFDGFITLSKQVGEELSDFTKAPSFYQAHPINLNLGASIDKSLAKSKLGLDEQINYLLFFGLVRKYKGLDLMLKAMAEPILANLSIKLLVVGEFYDDPNEYYDLIAELKLDNKVEIRNEFIANEAIKDYFSASDLVTQTYHTASQSGISQVAMNFDKPILVTNVGGLSEIVFDGISGYVVEKSPEAIAKAILDFYSNSREMPFSNAVAQEKKNYSWQRFSEKTIEFVQTIEI
tara:strand:- start:877 stop:2004 length:1128 start_codon:yes stop_codon:yes gene_type:complete